MRRLFPALFLALSATAHVGSPDVFFDGKAGPYQVFVTVRAPQVIPGVADIELRIPGEGVETVRITPTTLTGPGAKFAPTPDVATRSAQDPHYYTGSLWMMSSGSWQVRVNIAGSQGSGELRVPVPALARRTTEMDRNLGGILFGLMIFLVVGAVSIAGAASREGKLVPGVEPPPENKRRARIVMGLTAVFVIGAIYLGDLWWKAEAAGYSRIIFKPLAMETSVEGNRLTMRLAHTGWFQAKDFGDLVPDHNYLMHLFVVGDPGMDRMWHLHPTQASNGLFTQELPPMPAGRYKLYGDIVHRDGLPETVVGEIMVGTLEGNALQGDDSGATASEVGAAISTLGDGYRMTLANGSGVKARQLTVLEFNVVDKDGKPAEGMELYLGMPAHAAVLKKDGTVFAHLHPSGTVPMASLALAKGDSAADPHAGHTMTAALPANVTFPYGFPQAGDYRMFVQVRRAGKVQTGVFDLTVTE